MSNPTVATKLLTLVKGIFGRKEPVSATGSPQADESAQPRSAAPEKTEAVETTTETAEAEKAGDAEKAETPEKAEKPEATETAEAEKPEATETAEVEKAGDAEKAETPEKAEKPEEAQPESAVPATVDLGEEGAQIAEEIAVAEAHTEVASDAVLEKVRKDAAPSADDLAVPTYDDLTLPSIRARLRKLTVAQVRDLRAYEVAHEGRPEFIRMYDNRIAKLESGE